MQGWSAGASCNRMAEKLEYMPFLHHRFILDDRVQTRLSDNMKWWYIRLLAHQWDHGVVPLDGTACVGIVHPHMSVKRSEWEAFAEMIPDFFPPVDEYQGQNQTLEQIRADVVGAAEKRSTHASTAAKAKWAKQRAMLEESPGNARASAEDDARPHAPTAKGRGKGEGGRGSPSPPLPEDTQVDADASAQFVAHYMGVIRRVWPGQTRQEMTTNASILKQMFGKVSGELDAAICGLPIARPKTRPSMRLLWSKEIRDEVWTDSVRAHYQSMKEPRERGGEDRGAEHISETLARLSQARVS